MIRILTPLFIEGSVDAFLGYFVGRRSGNCPVTSAWWRSAILGAIIALRFTLISDR